jgi:hypothetical protein
VHWLDPEQGAIANAKKILLASTMISRFNYDLKLNFGYVVEDMTKHHHIWLGRSSATQPSIWGSSAGRESNTRWQQPGSVGGVLVGGEDVEKCLTYIGESIHFVLGFRLSPQTNRLVGDNGPGKKRGQTGCDKETDWAKARD